MERATSRGADRIANEHHQRLAAPALPLTNVTELQATITADEYAQPVYVRGYFLNDQLRVTGRSVAGQDADLVLDGLVITEGPAAGGVVPVVRGWVCAGCALPDRADDTVTVFGYLAGPEKSQGDLSNQTTSAIAPGELVNRWNTPILSGYVVEFARDLEESKEARDGVPIDMPMTERETRAADNNYLPPPKPTEEGGFNIQNAAYAAEWVIFSGFFLFLWVKLLRADVARREEDNLLAAYGFKDDEDADPFTE